MYQFQILELKRMSEIGQALSLSQRERGEGFEL